MDALVATQHARLVSFAERFDVRLFPGMRVLAAPPERDRLRLVLHLPLSDGDAMVISAEAAAADLAKCDDADIERLTRDVLVSCVTEALNDDATFILAPEAPPSVLH